MVRSLGVSVTETRLSLEGMSVFGKVYVILKRLAANGVINGIPDVDKVTISTASVCIFLAYGTPYDHSNETSDEKMTLDQSTLEDMMSSAAMLSQHSISIFQSGPPNMCCFILDSVVHAFCIKGKDNEIRESIKQTVSDKRGESKSIRGPEYSVSPVIT